MKRKNKKAFTLIELIAVLVILAIIALIATPLVMNIVKKAKDSANKRSIEAYGKAVELAVATHLLDTGDYPTSLDNLTVEYTGNEVVCNVKTLNEDGSVYLSECSVKDVEVKDTSTEDGYYHYGKKISNQITYLAYNVGDTVTYNGMKFYVIEDSDKNSDRVTMLKETPLTVDEVNTYGGVGTENNHVNMYVPSWRDYQTAYNYNGYGGMVYYSSTSCRLEENNSTLENGCTTDYESSEIKYVVDAWVLDKFSTGTLVEDETGYSARLLTFEDAINNLGYEIINDSTGTRYVLTENTPSWVYNSNSYWTMSSWNGSNSSVGCILDEGDTMAINVHGGNGFLVVRPVITILKSAI